MSVDHQQACLENWLLDNARPASPLNRRYTAEQLARAFSIAFYPISVDQLTAAMRAVGVSFEEDMYGTRWFYISDASPMLRKLRGPLARLG